VHMRDEWLRVDKQLKKAMWQALMVYMFDIDVSIHICILINFCFFFFKKKKKP
jgi:hypothetical protein